MSFSLYVSSELPAAFGVLKREAKQGRTGPGKDASEGDQHRLDENSERKQGTVRMVGEEHVLSHEKAVAEGVGGQRAGTGTYVCEEDQEDDEDVGGESKSRLMRDFVATHLADGLVAMAPSNPPNCAASTGQDAGMTCIDLVSTCAHSRDQSHKEGTGSACPTSVKFRVSAKGRGAVGRGMKSKRVGEVVSRGITAVMPGWHTDLHDPLVEVSVHVNDQGVSDNDDFVLNSGWDAHENQITLQ